MELEIAGLVDRPSVRLPITERLERLKVHQQLMKDPGCRTGHSTIPWPGKPGGFAQLFSDIIVVPYSSSLSKFPSFDTIDVGHIQPAGVQGDEPIRWWTIHTPCPFFRVFGDPAQDIFALQHPAHLDTIHIISIFTGNSVLDDVTLSTPVTRPDFHWDSNSIVIHDDVMLVTFMSALIVVGVTVVGWKDGMVRAVSLLSILCIFYSPLNWVLQRMAFPEDVGTSVCLVSETRLLVGGRDHEGLSLRLFSLEIPTEEHPSTPIHIVTYRFPPTLPNIVPDITIWRPMNRISRRLNQQPFTTAEGASVLSVNYAVSHRTIGQHQFMLYIHPSAFASFLDHKASVQDAQPLTIPWVSWGPKLTRFMRSDSYETFFGYNVAFTNNQLNFNTLDIARDLQRTRSSIQQDQLSYPHIFFDQGSPTTIPATEIFKEDIVTYLPYRWWGAPTEEYISHPIENNWVNLIP